MIAFTTSHCTEDFFFPLVKNVDGQVKEGGD